jgi:ribosomal protein L32
MYNEKLEALISAALTDGVLTEKERAVLFRRAQEQGIVLDEFEMVLDARLIELQRAERSAHKSQKYGEMRKCPACGAVIGSFQMICPDCGYEFIGCGLMILWKSS